MQGLELLLQESWGRHNTSLYSVNGKIYKVIFENDIEISRGVGEKVIVYSVEKYHEGWQKIFSAGRVVNFYSFKRNNFEEELILLAIRISDG